MKYINGAEYLCKVLKKNGVEYIFGLFGDIQTEFANAVRKSSLKWIGVHNEKSGGFMADIYSRVSGKPGIIFSTLGPGATNLASALANATQDRSSLIAISDQVISSDLRLETHQYIDLAKTFHPNTGITKYSEIIKDAKDLPYIVNNAFKISMSEPRGAVHISIPADIFWQKIDVTKSAELEIDGTQKNLNNAPKITLSYKELVKRLNTKKPGLVIAGGSIERCDAKKSFVSFIERYRLPILTTFRGKNTVPSGHPQCLATISRHLGTVLGEIIKEASYILTIGYDYNEGVKPIIWKGKDIINIDCYDNRISGIFEPPTIIGDLNQILNKLTKEKPPVYIKEFKFKDVKRKLQDKILSALDVENKSLHPKRIIDAVNKVYSENSIIVCDVGLNKYYSGLLLNATTKNQIIFSNGMSSMAFSSGALGAKMANSSKDVVVLVGDGGFLMDMQEVITTVQNQKIIVWIIFNNGGLGLVEQAQMKNERNCHGVRFNKITFSHLANAFGLYCKSIGKNDDIFSVLKKVKKMNKSAIIDVPVEYATRPE